MDAQWKFFKSVLLAGIIGLVAIAIGILLSEFIIGVPFSP
jgi:hypothetical protein